MSIFTTILKSVIAYILLLIVSRIVGRKVISRMTFFDYAVAVTFGSLTGSFCVGNDSSPLSAGIALATLGALACLTSTFSVKSLRFRKLVNSEPIVVIAKGELVKANMRKIRLTLGMLNSLLRERNVFNISEVEYALIENDGKISVLLKSNRQPLTPAHMGLVPPYQGLTTELIIDGLLLKENLAEINKNENWLMEQLSSKGISRIEDVFFAALDTSGKLYVSMGIEGTEEHGKYGIE